MEQKLENHQEKLASRAIADVSTVKSILLMLLAFAFGFAFGGMIHELGHGIIALLIGGYQVSFVFHPFIMPRTIINPAPLPGIIDIGGWVSDIGAGSLISLVAWRYKKPSLLPLLMYGPLSCILEGFSIAIGVISPGSDTIRFAIATGLPLFVFVIIGIAIFIIGLMFFVALFPLVDILQSDSYLKKLIIIMGGTATYMLLMIVYVNIFRPLDWEISRSITNFMATLILSIIFASLYKPLNPYLNRLFNVKHQHIIWADFRFPIVLTMSVIIFQLIFFNY